MGLTEKDRFRKWEAQLQEWMPEPPSNWRDIFALRDYVRQVAKKAKHRYCAIVLKPLLCAVTGKQTLASIKSAHQYGGDFISKIAAAALAGDPRNRDRVLQAFPEIIAQYGPGSGFYNEHI